MSSSLIITIGAGVVLASILALIMWLKKTANEAGRLEAEREAARNAQLVQDQMSEVEAKQTNIKLLKEKLKKGKFG